MGKHLAKFFGLILAATLASCGGGASGKTSQEVTTQDATTAETSDRSEGTTEQTTQATSTSDGFVGEHIQIGGNIAAFPNRVWNPEAALDAMCFVTDPEDRNIYNLTVNLKKGDVILFFFDYSWDKTLDYDDLDWDYYPETSGYASYVSDRSEGDDVSKKHIEIHIIKDARFTFSYHTLGKVLKGMKSGMVLTSLE